MLTKLKSFFSSPRIELFVRHCHFSEVSVNKTRIPGFCRKKCYQNLLKTTDPKRVNITFLLDTYHPSPKDHFVKTQSTYPVIEIQEGTETGSFLKLLEYVQKQNYAPDTILYFLEDDYLHRPGWVDVLLEGFTLPEASYVTLFDHRDKYTPQYAELKSKLFFTPSCHWRTTPSTTNTYAMRFKTLQKEMALHRQFSEGRRITADHEKFLALGERGSLLISSIPGWSTHVEQAFLSPCTKWDEVNSSGF